MRPRDPVSYKFFQEHRRKNSSSVPFPAVHQVSTRRLQRLGYMLILKGHPPQRLAPPVRTLQNLRRKLIVIHEQPGPVLPQCHRTRSGQRSHVHNHVGLQLACSAQRIRQHKPSFSVSVVDLYGLAVPRGDDVIRLVRAP